MPKRAVKKSVDVKQDKRIAKLERQFPSVREVVVLNGSQTFDSTTESHMFALMPSTLGDKKVDFRGFSLRTQMTYQSNTNQDIAYRIQIFVYKCLADYSGATAAAVEPLLSDVLNTSAANPVLANLNVDNTSRIRMLYDRTIHSTSTIGVDLVNYKKMYKKSISLLPLIDKAFVHRPFMLVTSTGHGTGAGAQTNTLNYAVDSYTLQLP